MVSVACKIRHKVCIIYGFFVVVHQYFSAKNYFLISEINLTTWGSLYTYLVEFYFSVLASAALGRWPSPNSKSFSLFLFLWLRYGCFEDTKIKYSFAYGHHQFLVCVMDVFLKFQNQETKRGYVRNFQTRGA